MNDGGGKASKNNLREKGEASGPMANNNLKFSVQLVHVQAKEKSDSRQF